MKKCLFVLSCTCLILFSSIAFAEENEIIENNDLELRMEQMELRLNELQTALDSKVSDCELKIMKWGIYHDNCPSGTVAGEVQGIPNTPLHRVTCYLYKLECSK